MGLIEAAFGGGPKCADGRPSSGRKYLDYESVPRGHRGAQSTQARDELAPAVARCRTANRPKRSAVQHAMTTRIHALGCSRVRSTNTEEDIRRNWIAHRVSWQIGLNRVNFVESTAPQRQSAEGGIRAMMAQSVTPTPLGSLDATRKGDMVRSYWEAVARPNSPLESTIRAVRASASRMEPRIKRVLQRALRRASEHVCDSAVNRALVRALKRVSERAEHHALYRADGSAQHAAHNSAVLTRSAAPCTTRGHRPHNARSAVPHYRAIQRPRSRVSHSVAPRVGLGDVKGGPAREDQRVQTGVIHGVDKGAVSGGPWADGYALDNAGGHARHYAAYGAVVARCSGLLAGRNAGRYQRVMCSATPGAYKRGSVSANRA